MAYPATIGTHSTTHIPGDKITSAAENAQSGDLNALTVKVGTGASTSVPGSVLVAGSTAGSSVWADQVFNVKAFGTTGTANDAATFTAALTAAGVAGGTLYVPAGTYTVLSELTLPYGVSVLMDARATVQAGAAMTAILSSSSTIALVDQFLEGGVWDANGLADRALFIRYFNHVSLRNLTAKNAQVRHIQMGVALPAGTSFNGVLTDVVVDRDNAFGNPPAGSIGLRLDNATDCRLMGVFGIGATIPIQTWGANHDLVGVHAYNHNAQTPPTRCFDLQGSQLRLTNCYADTPGTYGFYVEGVQICLVNCVAFNNNVSGLDNVATGYYGGTGASSTRFLGCTALGGDVTHRLAADYGGNLSLATHYGHYSNNCVASISERAYPQGSFGVTGSWDNPFEMASGATAIWVDATGKLRIKTGVAPTGDTDGTIVGTQT